MFHDRERDLFDLNDILHRSGAQFMVVSGRRRVGKATLLLEWARRSEPTPRRARCRAPATH